MSNIRTEKKSVQRDPLSRELNEFILKRPQWFVRNANAMFFIILLMITGIAWFLKYPDNTRLLYHLLEGLKNSF